MSPEQSSSFKAIALTRAFFELVQGEMGLLKFNIDELTEVEKANESDPEKWTVICSFIESIGSSTRSKYRVTVDVTNGTLEVKKVSPSGETSRVEGAWKMTPVTPRSSSTSSESQNTSSEEQSDDSGSSQT